MADGMLNLRKLTNGERLWIKRRRLGLTQELMATEYGISEKAYWLAETDTSLIDECVKGDRKLKPTLGELCTLARRRIGWSLKHTATMVGVSHVELLKRERNSDDRLVGFWREANFEL